VQALHVVVRHADMPTRTSGTLRSQEQACGRFWSRSLAFVPAVWATGTFPLQWPSDRPGVPKKRSKDAVKLCASDTCAGVSIASGSEASLSNRFAAVRNPEVPVVVTVVMLSRSSAALAQQRPSLAASELSPSSHSALACSNHARGRAVAGDAGLEAHTVPPLIGNGGLVAEAE